MKKKRSISSKRWLFEHFHDNLFYKKQKNNLRSRAWFKLYDIDMKYHLFKSGMHIIDLGASPGGWSKYAIKKIGLHGYIIACDINKMKPIKGVFFLQGDIFQHSMFLSLFNKIKKKIDVLMSDMSPNITGISYIDIPSFIILSNIVLKIALKVLSKKGILLIKVFQGDGFKKYLRKIRFFFNFLKICKPLASRNRSREVFILAIGLKK